MSSICFVGNSESSNERASMNAEGNDPVLLEAERARKEAVEQFVATMPARKKKINSTTKYHAEADASIHEKLLEYCAKNPELTVSEEKSCTTIVFEVANTDNVKKSKPFFSELV